MGFPFFFFVMSLVSVVGQMDGEAMHAVTTSQNYVEGDRIRSPGTSI